MTAQIDLGNVVFPDVMDLRTASIYLGLSEMRVRSLARDESLKASKDEGGVWQFAKADLDAFKVTPRTRKASSKPRGDGKAFIIRVPYQALEDVKEALGDFGIELQPRYNYAKQAEYKAKQAAKKAAAK